MPDIAAIYGTITGPWGPAIIAAATIFGGLLVAATFPKDAFGWIEDGVRSVVVADRERLHAAPAQPPESELLTEPRTLEPTVAGAMSGDDPAPNDDCAPDGEYILGRYCKMDTATTLEGLEFTIEVPGLNETDLEVRMVGDTIIVSGQLEPDRTDKTYRVVEREFGAFSRLIKVSQGVPLHRIRASLDRGVLTVFVPNPTIQVGKTITVNSAARRILQGDDVCELQIDLPGVDDSDIDVAIRDGVLTISCRPGPQAAKAGDATATRLLQSMELPAGVDANQIRAVLAKGVLTVTLPIAAGHRQRTIPLETAGASEPRPPAAGCCQSKAPIAAQTVPPLYFKTFGEPLPERTSPHG